MSEHFEKKKKSQFPKVYGDVLNVLFCLTNHLQPERYLVYNDIKENQQILTNKKLNLNLFIHFPSIN